MNKREFRAAKASELKDGEMKHVSLGGAEILLARVDGECFAVSAHCTHYGAPLVEGVLRGGRIVCPWHHACFNAKTGELEEPPAFDALQRFEVRSDGEQIFVEVPEDAPDRRTPSMIKREPGDTRQFVILGGGAAGFMAAQTLREEGFAGRIILVSREDRAPYDRPNLSKDYLQGHAEPEWMPLRPDDFFLENDIEIWSDRKAVKVDTTDKKITFEDGTTVAYDSLLIATGGKPRRLPFQSDKQANVFLLRSFADSEAIIASAEKGKRVVVIGTSFIGMEAASSLRTRGCEVTVVGPGKAPFEHVLGAEIGKMFQRVHESNGVKFRLGEQVKSFVGSGSKVDAVELENGERLDTDLVVVGVGVSPATDFLEGFELHKDGGVIADEFLSIATDVYAAGDIVHFPDPRTKELTRIEHWRTAMQQGRTAAKNMAGKRKSISAVPFFWTVQFDATLRYVGHVKDWDKIVFQGDVEKKDFLAFYIKDQKVLAVAGMNRDRDMAIWEERIRSNRVLSPDQLSTGRAEPLNNSTDSSSFSALRLL
jgi:NADPH-dependent 2,4-dienoyl-CoA reductase/sulfur reductase-like enzyme/nitrite reductase/ring-hydroxylating ferredoxin subunit